MTKISRKKKNLENKKSFYGEIKSIFYHFKGLSDSKNCIRLESAPLRNIFSNIFDWYYRYILSYIGKVAFPKRSNPAEICNRKPIQKQSVSTHVYA